MSADTLEFFDTTRRCEEPFSDLATGASRLYVVVGGPSAGKSMTLTYLSQQLKTRDDKFVVPVLIDFARHSIETPLTTTKVLKWLLDELCRCLKKEYGLCTLLDNLFDRFSQSPNDPVGSFGNGFGEVRRIAEEHLGKGVREVQLVALIDNTDKLADSEVAGEIFIHFHALLMREPRVRGFLNLVLAGGDKLYDRVNEPNGVWRHDAEILMLTGFEPTDTQALLSAKTGGQLPGHIGLLLYACSGGHPFLLQCFLDELKAEIEDEWDAVTADMVLGTVEAISDRIDVWHEISSDDSQLEQDAYRLLIENRPDWETLVSHLSGYAAESPSRLQALSVAFGKAQAAGADDFNSLAAAIDAALAELDISLAPDSDWPTRLEKLRDGIPELYNLLASSCAALSISEFRRRLVKTGEDRYLYKRALDRLTYAGAIQALPRKHYIIQGQIFFGHFQTFSPQGKYPLMNSLREKEQQYEQSLSLLRQKAAEYGGDVYAPLEVQNQIKDIEKSLAEARRELARLEKE